MSSLQTQPPSPLLVLGRSFPFSERHWAARREPASAPFECDAMRVRCLLTTLSKTAPPRWSLSTRSMSASVARFRPSQWASRAARHHTSPECRNTAARLSFEESGRQLGSAGRSKPWKIHDILECVNSRVAVQTAAAAFWRIPPDTPKTTRTESDVRRLSAVLLHR